MLRLIRVYRLFRRLVKRYTGKPVDKMATEAYAESRGFRKHVNVCSAALEAHRLTYPEGYVPAVEEEVGVVVARLVRHVF